MCTVDSHSHSVLNILKLNFLAAIISAIVANGLWVFAVMSLFLSSDISTMKMEARNCDDNKVWA